MTIPLTGWLKKIERSPLKREAENLKRAIARTQRTIDRVLAIDVHGSPPYHCCHQCAFPWLSELSYKQQKRRDRLCQIEAKLARDGKKT